MVEVSRKAYPLNPTLQLVTPEGRATAEFFRILKAIGDLIGNITIEDGEVVTSMLEAEVIRVSTLFADEVIITSKVALQAITEITTGTQPFPVGPNGNQILITDVPTVADNTAVLIQYVGFMALPSPDPSNVGGWQIYLYRNGSLIAATPVLNYDDNYAYPVSVVFIDEAAGVDPEYQLLTHLVSGAGNFTIGGGQAVFTQLKR